MLRELLTVLAFAGVQVGCTDATFARPRSSSLGSGAGILRDGADDVHGGSDMPGKTRGSREHERHTMVHK